MDLLGRRMDCFGLKRSLDTVREPVNQVCGSSKRDVLPSERNSSAGDMAAQVKAMIEEFEYSAVLIDSDDAGSDSSDSTVIDSNVAVNLIN
ncbi:hypothetical protein QYM36_014755 [Artemia franciscana]|uniref:Uncharacterized protein n=1 Tax=Artemia franciscana TaxID=6661 RepID=A0AA88H7Q5_ARTSF|nr:hypothetical protein QYM36_014755 [Artemia franciscana]